jgi:hypothetical protein
MRWKGAGLTTEPAPSRGRKRYQDNIEPGNASWEGAKFGGIDHPATACRQVEAADFLGLRADREAKSRKHAYKLGLYVSALNAGDDPAVLLRAHFAPHTGLGVSALPRRAPKVP